MTNVDLCTLIATELLSIDGQIRRIRLKKGGLQLAYAGNAESGQLTLSRPSPTWPSKNEIEVVQRDFAAAAMALELPILKWLELERAEAKTGTGKYNVIRLKVWFGEQREFPFGGQDETT